MFVSQRKAETEFFLKKNEIFSAFWSSGRKPHFTASWLRPVTSLYIYFPRNGGSITWPRYIDIDKIYC